jgi:hypothetical protein
MAAAKRDSRIDGKVLQFSDMTPQQRKTAEGAAFKQTSNMADRADAYLESGKGKGKEREAIQVARPYLKNKNVTVASAAANRTKMVESAARSETTRHAHESVPGAGWYFEHHAAIDNAAKAHGFDTSRAITASAVMSPQNSPENERAAASALMAAHSGGKVFMSPALHSHLTSQGIPVASAHRDRMVSAHELHPEALAELSNAEIRDSVEHHGFDLKDVSRGGTKTNISKAVRVLRGEVSEHEAIDPHSSPKVFSYRDNIRDSRPNTDVHQEYLMRAADLGSKIRGENIHGQQMFDYHGLRNSTEGVLSPTRHTAEDTWMNSISHGQKNMVVPGTTTNVMKTSGTVLGYSTSKTFEGESAHPDARIKAPAVQHAVNNAATIRSAAQLGKKYGVDGAVPAILSQEVPWTEARRAGEKDPQFKRDVAGATKKAPRVGQQFKQLGLF